MLCEYGCGEIYNFELKNGKKCCSSHTSKCREVKRKNSIAERPIQNYKDRYENLPEETKGSMAWSKGKKIVSNDTIFVENSKFANDLVKKRILQDGLLEYKCNECKITDWQGKTIVLELEHCNGVNNDHRMENLKFLCPNCHSQTSTFRGRNKNSGKTLISDEKLLTAIKETSNIRQALQSVGLAPKGGNYARVKSLKEKFNI